MDYVSVKDTALKWGITPRRVVELCNTNRVEGAKQISGSWVIPADAIKPKDNRVKDTVDYSIDAHPFLKWAGGKKQLLHHIRQIYPFSDAYITKYAEPFVGGGAVLFDILNNYDLEYVYINDINTDLINCYYTLRMNSDALIQILHDYEKGYLALDNANRTKYYNEKRSRFNLLKKNPLDESNSLERAALMIFLNRTCFNGLYRENSTGGFNVPMGRYKNPVICDTDNLKRVSKKLEKVTIVNGGYKELDDFIDNKTFVYFDPPYRPLSITSNFNAYDKSGFNDKNQTELADYFKHLSGRGAKVALSNSDPKNADKEDNFFDNLYHGFNINRILASRSINSNGKNRGKITELLINN